MIRATAFSAVLACLLAAPCRVLAQSGRPISVTGSVEYAHITEDEGVLGAGLGAAGGLQFHLTDATSLDLEIGRERHVRDLELFAVAFDAQGHPAPLPFTERWEGTATFVLALVSRTFGASTRARPVVWGGGGFMTHGGTTRGPHTQPQVPAGFTLQPGDAQSRKGRSATAFAVDGGVGVEARVSDRFTVRPFAGLRLVGTGGFGPKYIIRGGARVAYRF